VGTTSFLLVGVGGQGTLLASNIVAEVGLRAGYQVKKSEVHGMAQRGGSVSSHVRWGERVHSPLIGEGEVDILVAFERVEAVRHVDALRPGGKVLVNDHAIVPMTVTAGSATYPAIDEILAALRQATPDVTLVPGVRIAQELGNARANNVVLLGVLSRRLDVEEAIWREVIADRVPPRYKELNLEAFARGRSFSPRRH
jgi:indolepyruvate ferredoxin oxidoreductase beta subunit